MVSAGACSDNAPAGPGSSDADISKADAASVMDAEKGDASEPIDVPIDTGRDVRDVVRTDVGFDVARADVGADSDSAMAADAGPGTQDARVDVVDAGGVDAGMDVGGDAGTAVDVIDVGVSAPDVGSTVADVGVPDVPRDAGVDATDWVQQVGSARDDSISALAASNVGGVIVGGSFSSTAFLAGVRETSAGLSDGYIVALDPDGTARWGRRFGGTSYDSVNGVALDGAGNIYVAGDVEGAATLGSVTTAGGAHGFFVSSFTSAGDFRWSRRYDGASATHVNEITVDASGNVYAVGEYDSRTDFGGGLLDAPTNPNGIVVSLTSDGGFRWTRVISGGWSQFTNVAFDASGNGVVVGYFQTSATVDGTAFTAAGRQDALAIGITATGAVRWTRRLGSDDDDYLTGVTLDASGNSYVSGTFYSSTLTVGTTVLANARPGTHSFNALLASFDSSGSPRWAHAYGSNLAQASTVALDGAGNLQVAGSFLGSVDFGGVTLTPGGTYIEAFLATFGPDGTARRARRFGNAYVVHGGYVRPLGTGVVFTGDFTLSLTIGRATVSSYGGVDAFVARLEP